MSVTGMGTRQKTVRLPVLGLVSAGLLLATIVLFAIELTRFAQNRDLLQTDISVAGVPVSGLRLSEAVQAWNFYYQQPIELDYGKDRILLDPAEIGFSLKNDEMLGEVQNRESISNYWSDFWNYLWRRPASPVEIPLKADYDQAKLRAKLQDIADRYDKKASDAQFNLDTMIFGSGSLGSGLDVEASINQIDKVLHQPQQRKVVLQMKSEGAHGASLQTLKQAILAYLKQTGFVADGKTTTVSVVVIDLNSGDEMSINPDVAYAGMSTIKIPIMLNIFGHLNFAIPDDYKWLMGASILCSANDASNFLIQLSASDMGTGLTAVTNTAQTLGAKNTFLSAPLFVGAQVKPFSIQSPKTSPNPNFNTKPDPWNQTTAEDMAVMLEELYDCSEYNSGLHAAYPESTAKPGNLIFTQTKCKQMIELLSGNIIGRMIELGVPPGTRVAHKNGWGVINGGQHASDAGIVYSAGRNYVIAVYTWQQLQPGDLNGNITPWETIEGISRLTYNFFNADKPLVVARVPENKLTALECVMPNTAHPERLDLNNINNGRFDKSGNLVPDACYDFPRCTSKTGTKQIPATPVPGKP